MRPIATEQNAIRFPLNELLGTAANVRLMRVLAEEVVGSIGVPEAADKTGLTLAGARRALLKLAKTGYIQQVGGKRSQLYALRESDPIIDTVRELFRTESKHYQELKVRIRAVLANLPEIQAAWIDSPPAQVGKSLQIGILSDSRSLLYLGDQARMRMVDVESDFDLTIEIRTFSLADVPEDFLIKTELLVGYLNTGLSNSGGTHAERDERAAQYSHAIVKVIDNDPSLIKRASRYLEFQLEDDHGSATHDLREWSDILKLYSVQRLKDFLVSETPRAKRLRQSSPFFAVISHQERDKIISIVEKVR